MPDEPSTVQPEGQGGGGTSDAPYAEYLNRIPEEVRGQVEPIFREWDANTTRRFQEAAEYRSKWQQYEPLGLDELSPDEVAWALQFRQAAVTNPSAIQQWYDEYAQAHGLTAAEKAQMMQQGGMQEVGTPGVDEFVDPTVQVLKQQLEPIQQQLEQMNRWRAQQEEAQRYAEAERLIQHQMDEIKSKHPDEFNEAAIQRLIPQYVESDPQHAVQRAFADWQAIRAQIERDTLQAKVNQPPPAESGGLANAAPDMPRTLAEANKIALERLRQAREA